MREQKKWTESEIQYLKDNFENTRSNEIALALNRSYKSILMKARKLNLLKSKIHRSNMIAHRNKLVGRDLNYNILKEIASKYKTRSEFQLKDKSAYSTCVHQNLLDDVCEHMMKHNYSTPQLLLFEMLKILIPNAEIKYNDRIAIKPYEIDIYLPEFKLGIEYNGKLWHIDNKKDEIKSNLCIEAGIELIIINENTRNYVLDIKNQLINNLYKLNKICKLNISNEDIININESYLYNLIKNNIINVNDVINIVNKYDNFHIFKKFEPKIYSHLNKMKLINKFTSHLKRDRIDWNIEKINEVVSKYTEYSDFLKENHDCYSHIKKNKLEYLLNNLNRKNTIWNFNLIKNLIIKNNFKKIHNLKINYPSAVGYLRKNKLIDECRSFMNERNMINKHLKIKELIQELV